MQNTALTQNNNANDNKKKKKIKRTLYMNRLLVMVIRLSGVRHEVLLPIYNKNNNFEKTIKTKKPRSTKLRALALLKFFVCFATILKERAGEFCL